MAMKKTYFAKYLPVEGEIKKGDMVLNTHLEEWVGVLLQEVPKNKKIKAIVNYNSLYHNIFNCKKVKLFLCSRDKNVGEKILVELDNKEIKEFIVDLEIAAFGVFDKDKIGENRHINQVFKVIGEISADAIWVKEGDEFDADEVKIIGTEGTSQMPVYVEIKCGQCKTFH